MLVVAALAFRVAGAQATRWQPSPGHTQIPLWPATSAPDTESFGTAPAKVGGKPWMYVANVSRPTITVYSPSADNSGVAVLVFPGGGYNLLAFNPNIHVTRRTPPTFLLQVQTDSIDGVNQVLAYYNALRNAGVPDEARTYR